MPASRQPSRTSWIFILTVCCLFWRSTILPGQEPEPIFRLEPQGPTSYITGLCFSPDGKTLYSAGFDKVVRVWGLNESNGQFELDDRATFRVPIGPGNGGVINAIALSDDGNWLAVAGRGYVRGEAGFRDAGRLIPSAAMSDSMRLDHGVIYLFNTATRQSRTLRGHLGEVIAMTFVPRGGQTPYLVSAAADVRGEKHQSKLIAWDLGTQQPVAEHAMPWQVSGSTETVRPRLAGWQTDAGPVVGCAWGTRVQDGRSIGGGGYLAVWPFTNKRAPVAIPNRFEACNTIAPYFADHFLSADDAAMGNRFLWRLTWFQYNPGLPAAVQSYEKRFPLTATLRRPRALSMVSRGKSNLAAVILGDVGQRQYTRHELQLIDLTGGNVVAVADLGVPADGKRAPTIAGAVNGKHVAVAGFGDHSIRVFGIDDLRQGNARPQVLRSVGQTIRRIGFARHSDSGDLAIALADSSSVPVGGDRSQTSEQMFLLKQRTFLSAKNDPSWKSAVASAGAFGFTPQGKQLRITENGRAVSTIDAPPSDQPIIPAIGSTSKPPMIALATHSDGAAAIWLYEARTGTLFRKLTSHTLPITSLAFSSDGSLLASAGDDQFVCVWDLSDTGDILGKHGVLDGLVLNQQDDGVVVDRVIDSGAGLRAGDRLSGVSENGNVIHAWRSPGDVYATFWDVQPGRSVDVNVVRSGNQSLTVALPVSQAQDQQNPLFSVFVFRNDSPEQNTQMTRWIGWSPTGYYDASDRDAENQLGFQFNRFGESPPVSFARVDRYRDEYRFPGLLDQLINLRRPPLLSYREPPPMPRMQFSFPDSPDLGLEQNVAMRMRQRRIRLHLSDYPIDRVKKIELRVADQILGEFSFQPDGSYLALIEPSAWIRGRQQIEAVADTVDDQYSHSIDIRYIPPAPELSVGELPRTTRDKELTLETKITLGDDNEPVEYRIIHQHSGQTSIVKQGTSNQDARIEATVQLQPGENWFQIVAVNQRTGVESWAYETARQTFKVQYDEPTPLSLSVVSIISSAGQAPEVPLDFVVDGPIRTASPSVKTVLTATSEQAPTIRRTIDEQADPTEIAIRNFQSGRPTTIEDEITLKPGLQTIRYEATTQQGEVRTIPLQFEFQPPLPSIEQIVYPQRDDRLIAGTNQIPADVREIPIVATLSRYDPMQPVVVEVLQNGSIVDAATKIDREGKLTARVPAVSGGNEVRIRIGNSWRPGEFENARVSFEFRRPPIVTSIQSGEIREEPFTDLEIKLRSTDKPTQVTINDQPIATDRIRPSGDDHSWIATQRVGLTPGENRFRVRAENSDGWSVAVEERRVEYVPPPEPPPMAIVSIDPGMDFKTTEPTVQLRLRVSSESPLSSVHLYRGQQVLESLDQIEAGEGGKFSIDKMVSVDLSPGVNSIKLNATNDGGQAVSSIHVSKIERPVEVIVERIVSEVPGGRRMEILPGTRLGSVVSFAEATSQWNPTIEGYIRWTREAPELDSEGVRAQAWVNGFQQPPQFLEKRVDQSRQRRFRLPLVLNQNQDNRVVLRFPGLKDVDESPLELMVDCTEPRTGQRLHVIIVGVGDKKELREELVQEFVGAISAERLQGGMQFRSEAFKFGRIYDVLTGNHLDKSNVYASLYSIGERISQLNQSEHLNDVIMLIYQGGELVEKPDEFFLTMQPVPENVPLADSSLRRRHLSSVELTDAVQRMQGAQILLLDVARQPETIRLAEAKLPGFDQAAVMRYAWLKLPVEVKNRLMAAIEVVPDSPSVRLSRLRDEITEQAKLIDQRDPNALRFEHFIPSSLETLLLIGQSMP